MPCAACTYMPNASWRRRGGKAQGEGYLPPEAKRRASAAKVCTSEARKTVGKPLALRQGRALSRYRGHGLHAIPETGFTDIGEVAPQRGTRRKKMRLCPGKRVALWTNACSFYRA